MHNRPRRNRKSAVVRDLVRETRVHTDQLIMPLFLIEDKTGKNPIASMPDRYQLGLEPLLREIEECMELGVRSFDLFPAVADALKDREATYSYRAGNFYLEAAARVKKEFPECCLISDVAMDPYSSDGHDGLVEDGRILNDPTLPILGKMAVAQAQAGFDIIAPSDMMDGRVGYIRDQLDRHNFQDVSIMSYTAKYASAFYGPFRDALNSAPKSGDKKTYQMDPANRREAMREADLDVLEGADYLMVKPALSYLDIIYTLKQNFDLPIAAYHVSGEYSMVKAAVKNGWLDYERAMTEILTSISRAGADIILTYFAKDFARMQKQ